MKNGPAVFSVEDGKFTDDTFTGRDHALYWPSYDSFDKIQTLNVDFLENNIYW